MVTSAGKEHLSLQGPPGAFSAPFSCLAYKSRHHSWGALQWMRVDISSFEISKM